MMAIAHEGLRPYVEAIWGWDSKDHQERFRAQFEPSCISIIQLDGRDVGYVKVEDRKDCLFLAGIYVGKNDRNRGIGSEVLVGLMRDAAAVGRPLRLRVLLPNPAQRLYLRLGFHVTETTDSHVFMEFGPDAALPAR